MGAMSQVDPDAALMMRVRKGDTDAFRQLVERYQRAVINVMYRSLGDLWEAEDLAQRVFVQVYRSAKRYKPKAKFTTWLFTIVHNTVLNEHRRRARHAAESLDAMQTRSDTGESAWQMADERLSDPSEQAAEREVQARIFEAVKRLPDAQRTAVILCRYHGESYEEIARVLGCTVGAVKSLLHRARQTLKEELKGLY